MEIKNPWNYTHTLIKKTINDFFQSNFNVEQIKPDTLMATNLSFLIYDKLVEEGILARV